MSRNQRTSPEPLSDADMQRSPARRPITPGRIALAAGLLSAILYLLTMNRTFGFVDKGELVAVGSTLGIAHPTGYPTIMLLGFLFTKLLPMRSVLALNAMAAILTAAGTAVLALLFDDLLRRLSGTARVVRDVRKGGKEKGRKKEKDEVIASATATGVIDPSTRALYAGLAALLIAFTATWWNQGNGFEVYSLHALMMPLVSLLFLRYVDEERAKEDDGAIGFTRRGFLFALMLGLSFTNHLTTILLAPAFLVYYFWMLGLKKRSFMRLLYLAPPFLLGLLPYLWLPIRASMKPRFNWGDPSSFVEFMRHVSGRIYQTYMFTELKADLDSFFGGFPAIIGVLAIVALIGAAIYFAARANRWLGAGVAFITTLILFMMMFGRYKVFHQQTAFFFSNLPSELAYVGIALALLGVAFLSVRHAALGAWTALLFTACILYSGHYEIMEIGPYYMTAIFAIGIWCVAGLAWLHELAGRKATLAIAGVLVALNCWTNFEASDESGNTLVEDMTANMLQTLPQNAIVFSGQWDFWVAGSFYMQGVEAMRPDVMVIDPELLRRRWYVDELAYTYPEFMSKVKEEAETFKREVYKFDNDLQYDANVIQSAYIGLMNAMIDRNIATRPVCVTGEVDPAIGAKYRRTPSYLTLRLLPDSAYLPETFPSYRFSFWDGRVDGYTAKVYELYARSSLGRALYEAQHGHEDIAMKYYNLCLSFDPGFTREMIPGLPLNSEEQVTGMMGFFDQARAMRGK